MTLPQILAAGSIAVASTCIHGILVSGLASNSIPGVAINGWFILLSLIVSVFDIVAIRELFVDIRVLNIKIPFHHSLWYLSTIIVSFISYHHIIVIDDCQIKYTITIAIFMFST